MKNEINKGQLELSKLYSKWADKDPRLTKFLKSESRKSFERAGLRVVENPEPIYREFNLPFGFRIEYLKKKFHVLICAGTKKWRFSRGN